MTKFINSVTIMLIYKIAKSCVFSLNIVWLTPNAKNVILIFQNKDLRQIKLHLCL